jgi:hypothetical protein
MLPFEGGPSADAPPPFDTDRTAEVAEALDSLADLSLKTLVAISTFMATHSAIAGPLAKETPLEADLKAKALEAKSLAKSLRGGR